jgi:hypothetical protein
LIRRAHVRRQRQLRVAVDPVGNDILVELLRPQQTGIGLPADGLFDARQGLRDFRSVEGVGFGLALGEDLLEVAERSGVRRALQGEP